MNRQRWWGWLGAMAIAAPLAAQQPADEDPGMHIHPAFGIRVGVPQRASVALGLVSGADWKSGAHPRSPEVALFVEPGWSAGRASLGVIKSFGSLGSAVGITGTVMRTWNDSWSMPDNRTYVGAELLVLPVFRIGPRVGVFRAVRGSNNSWYVVGDFGFGL